MPLVNGDFRSCSLFRCVIVYKFTKHNAVKLLKFNTCPFPVIYHLGWCRPYKRREEGI